MFSFLNKTGPPKTDNKNYIWVPHLESLLSWFLKKDAQIGLVHTQTIRTLFNEGLRPDLFLNNNPETLSKESNNKVLIDIPERWLLIRIWMDLINIKKLTETNGLFEQNFELTIDALDQYGKQTLLTAGEMIFKYNLDPLVKNLPNELSKIPNKEEKEIFKQNYLADTLNAAEMRFQVWIFKELFNKDYKLKP